MEKHKIRWLLLALFFVMLSVCITIDVGKVEAKTVFKRVGTGKLTLYEGQTYSLGIKNKSVTYSLSKKGIIYVTPKGKIKALKQGSVYLTAKSADKFNTKTKMKVTVVFKKNYRTIKKIQPKKKNMKLSVGEHCALKFKIKPKNASNQNLKYKSNKGKIVSVNGKGVITARKKGTAKITISTLDGSRKKSVVKVTVVENSSPKPFSPTYVSGKLNDTPKQENMIGMDGKEGDDIPFVNNRMILYFDQGINSTRKMEIIKEMGATIIGSLDIVDMYQVELSKTFSNQESLEVYIQSLCEKYSEIISAEPEWIILSYDKENVSFVENVNEENWWLKTVDAELAWKYAKEMTPVRVGVIDDGFDIRHEDLNIQFSSAERKAENSVEKHGTHVAGIIGAEKENQKGITGLAWMNLLYGYDWRPTKGQHWVTGTKILELFVRAVEDGCKVINMSLGCSASLANNEKRFSPWTIFSLGRSTSIVMGKLLEKGYDFVVVQSAGNGAADGIGVDAVNNGHFASIMGTNCYRSHRIAKEDILKRILIVGAVERSGNEYLQTAFSNGGVNVKIAAPGRNIYSTLPGNAYGKLSGTSMAAPIVAATASMIWAVDPSFTGAEVQEILVDYTNKIAKDHRSSLHTAGDVPIVNAGLAVEEAYKRKKQEREYRIELEWGDVLEDLDAHLRGIDARGNPIHVYFKRIDHEAANLDSDDTFSNGKEIITITDITKLKQVYFGVHNYTGSNCEKGEAGENRLAQTGAVVKLYKGDILLRSYLIPQNTSGTLWRVFEIDGLGNVLDINSMEYEKDSEKVLANGKG